MLTIDQHSTKMNGSIFFKNTCISRNFPCFIFEIRMPSLAINFIHFLVGTILFYDKNSNAFFDNLIEFLSGQICKFFYIMFHLKVPPILFFSAYLFPNKKANEPYKKLGSLAF